MTLTTRFEATACWLCGCPFAVPRDFLQRRIADNRAVYCPGGHKNHFGKPAKPEAIGQTEREALREKVLELHRQEQSEARVADGKPPQ